MSKISFASDYQEGAHPAIIERICKTNLVKCAGYGMDKYCKSAADKIRLACETLNAGVHFLVGGTQTNAVVIDALLKSYQGVIAADSGHISVHEAGAIELGGHKVLALSQKLGKITDQQIDEYCRTYWNDCNCEHMVMPGMVYLSQPTEYGTIYSLSELTAIKEVCLKYKMPLYVDGARLAYALSSPENDVTLKDLASLADVFYIGGTKCGALFGEAVIIPDPSLIPHFFTIIKQHGALLAKGRLLGLQFDTLFSDRLYERIGLPAIETANILKQSIKQAGYSLAFDSPTNQIFVILGNEEMEKLLEKIEFSFWEKYDENHTVVRFATSWATTKEQVSEFIEALPFKNLLCNSGVRCNDAAKWRFLCNNL